jgi:hydrogenase nickel incorporation protein HypA/HybF
MHELSIAQSIAEAVEIKAEECGAARVKRVRLKIGEASGIVTDSLAFCFEMIASQTPVLQGAYVSIDRVPHRAFCRHCVREFDVLNFIARCPACEEWSAEIISGNELEILDMEIEMELSSAV